MARCGRTTPTPAGSPSSPIAGAAAAREAAAAAAEHRRHHHYHVPEEILLTLEAWAARLTLRQAPPLPFGPSTSLCLSTCQSHLAKRPGSCTPQLRRSYQGGSPERRCHWASARRASGRGPCMWWQGSRRQPSSRNRISINLLPWCSWRRQPCHSCTGQRWRHNTPLQPTPPRPHRHAAPPPLRRNRRPRAPTARSSPPTDRPRPSSHPRHPHAPALGRPPNPRPLLLQPPPSHYPCSRSHSLLLPRRPPPRRSPSPSSSGGRASPGRQPCRS